MSDLSQLTTDELAKLLKQIQQARAIAMRPVLNYRARAKAIKAEMVRRVSEEAKGE